MKKPLGFYDYTVILTYCGMLSATVGIFLAIEGRFTESLICLMVAGICDMFDGAVAATKKRTAAEKRFGIQIDSLSDLISFGAMPAVWVFCYTGSAVPGAVFILAALIRLAYFNVLEEERQDREDGKRKSYLGLPVTSIALLLPLVYIAAAALKLPAFVFIILLFVCAVCYIAPFSLKKPQKAGKIAMIVIGLAELMGIIALL